MSIACSKLGTSVVLRRLDNGRDTGICCSQRDLQITKSPTKYATTAAFNVAVRKLDGSYVDYRLTSGGDTTVLYLKRKIQKDQKLPVASVRLRFGGRSLQDGKTLKDYGVKRDSVIEVFLRLLGGGLGAVGFAFADIENGTKLGFSKSAPSYRAITQGLNLEGRCSNSLCAVYNRLVWSPIGFGKDKKAVSFSVDAEQFNIGRLIHETPCPACKHFLRPDSVVSCGFYKCRYAYQGYTQNANVMVKGSGKVSYDDGIEYHDGISNGKKWSWLAIKVERLPKDSYFCEESIGFF